MVPILILFEEKNFDVIFPQGGPLPKIMVKIVFLLNIPIWVPFD